MQVAQSKTTTKGFSRTPVAAGIVMALASPALLAQQAGQIEEVIVTAQKREQSLQDVPISIQMLGEQAIQELNLTNFQDYTEMLPSVSIEPSVIAGTSFSRVYMRGIATAGDGQATTSLPSVGMYLDELSITTIQGNIDVHMYDIARVEALAGPQGTLYGASSQAGTIRVITNRPAIGEKSSSITAGANTVNEGGTGYSLEGYANLPIGEKAAIRLVGWTRSDAGWIDNVAGTRTFPGNDDTSEFYPDDPDTPEDESLIPNPTWCGSTTDCSSDDITLDNSDLAKKDYNTLDTIGARAALRVELNDTWTVSPTVMFQRTESEGSWADDLSDILQDGDYAVTHFKEEFTDDEWGMIGLTIEGSIGNFDVVYAGSYLDRSVDGSADYSDYSYWYDVAYATYVGYAGYYADLHFAESGSRAYPNQFFDNAGTRVMTGARYTNDDNYTKLNHEVRISTNPEKRVRGVLGFFAQKQFHDFEQHWEVEGGVAPSMELNGGGDPRFDDTVYLNSMFRTDRDFATFGSVSFDLTDDLELTLGARFFNPEVHVKGFFGFPVGFQGIWGTDGETQCDSQEGDPGWTPAFNGQEDWKDKPCLNVDKTQEENGNVGRVNLTWNVDDDNMVYFTWSEGYRPGGIQRRPSFGEYESDFLTNIEVGWKTQWIDNRLQLNGALFTQEWEDIQIALTGENAITLVANGPTASVDGLEMDMLWLATDKLRLSASAAWYDSQLDDDYCCASGEAGDPDAVPLAPKGTRLPITPEFKANAVARYMFGFGSFDSYLQGALIYVDDRDSDLDQFANEIKGVMPSYTKVDLAAGMGKETWSLDLFISNATGADEPLYYVAECVPETCGPQIYGRRITPRTIGLQYTKDFD